MTRRTTRIVALTGAALAVTAGVAAVVHSDLFTDPSCTERGRQAQSHVLADVRQIPQTSNYQWTNPSCSEGGAAILRLDYNGTLSVLGPAVTGHGCVLQDDKEAVWTCSTGHITYELSAHQKTNSTTTTVLARVSR